MLKPMLALSLAALLSNAGLAAPPAVFSPSDRAAATGRPVAVSVAPQIGTSVVVGRVVSDTIYGGGLLGAILLSSMDDKRERMAATAGGKAQSTIAPLLAALKDDDFSDLALKAGRNALATVGGIDPAAVMLVPSPSAPTVQAHAAVHPSGQLVLLSFRTQMAPDFTHLQVIADIAVVRSKTMEPLYGQRIVSIVELKQRSYDHQINVARWAADDARAARAAIAVAYRRLETVIPAVVNLDAAKYAVVTSKAKTGLAFGAGFYGPLLLRDEVGPVIWSKGNGFIAIQPAAD